MLGAATSALTFFRQKRLVGLALAGTIFDPARRRDPAAAHIERRPAAPRGWLRVVEQAPDGELTGVGVDLGQQIPTTAPEAARPMIEPFIDCSTQSTRPSRWPSATRYGWASAPQPSRR